MEKPAQVSSALTFDAETIKAAKNLDGTFETAVAPTLTTAPGYDGTITYTSSDAAVVTIDAATGALTLKGVGTATITASATETSSFFSSEASYTVIVYAIENGAFDFSMGNYGSEAVAGTSANTAETTWTAGSVTIAVTGRNVWYNGSSLRLYKKSGDEAAGSLTFSVPEGSFITKITGLSNILTPGDGSEAGSTWQGTPVRTITFTHNGGGTATLSKVTVTVDEVEVKVTSAGYATFCSAAALNFTGIEGIAAYTATVSGTEINFTRINKVAAQTGVLLRSTNGEAVTATVPVLTGSADDATGNVLVGTLTTIDALATEGEGVTNYILNNGANGVGFYQAAGQKVGAGKAYLSVTGTGSAKSFTINLDGTGIGEVQGETFKASGSEAIYDITGRQLNSKPAKGLYIMNGKKYIK